MLKHTTWHPDTCKCVITYAWDSDVPADVREHTFVSVKPCAVHAPPAARGVLGVAVAPALTPEAIVAIAVAAHTENVRKNQAIATVLEQRPDLTADAVAWRIDETRKVVLSVPPVRTSTGTVTTRGAGLQQALDARFGAGVIGLD